MRKPLFHLGIYLEGLRRLRLSGIVMLVLFTVFELFPILMTILGQANYGVYCDDFCEIHSSLYILHFIVPVILTLTAFRFQTSRCDSDFYHSLPVTTTALSLSRLAASASWSAIIVIGSSAVLGIAAAIARLLNTQATAYISQPSFGDILPAVGASLVSCLFMTAVFFLSTALCGTTVSTLFTAAIVLFAPQLLLYFLSDAVLDTVQVVPYSADSRLNPLSYLLIYGNNDSALAWVITTLLTIGATLFGLWCAHRRPSETAGRASVSPALHIVFRTLLALACCLPAILMIFNKDYDIFTLGLIYLFAAVVYFLFELFTVKKAKALLKAIPWLGLVAALNVLCIVGMHATVAGIWAVRPTPNDVDGVRITAITEYDFMGTYAGANDDIYTLYTTTEGMSTERPALPTDYIKFRKFAELYKANQCDEAVLTDEESKRILCESLDLTVKAAEHGNSPKPVLYRQGVNKEWCVYTLEIEIDTGAFSHARTVYVYDSELIHLLEMIDTKQSVPTVFYDATAYPTLWKEM